MSIFKLEPLTPGYVAVDHKIYLEAIGAALAQNSIKNIALSGGYGVGKSSVLKELARTHKRVVQVSFSPIGVSIDKGKLEETTTNRIQKEIVKQLLYMEEPHTMPGSRFRRIARFKVLPSLFAAVFGGIALTLFFFLAGWTAKLQKLFALGSAGLWFQLPLFITLSAGTLCALALSHNRFTIKGLKVANTEITLASDQTSYFDEFLDEIVYFFDVTKSEIVVFEDIDRFDDPYIFETLKILNTLLNGSKQLDGRIIRFIYAIRDSIFEEIGEGSVSSLGPDGSVDGESGSKTSAQVARANRTKFFDLVIPVVPFITHRNARDLIGRVMADVEDEIAVELLDLAARYLPEMRLIKNVHNEFLIFRERVFAAEEGALRLRPDELFAMMLYKNTHLSDFEKIITGESKLDLVYVEHRRLVRDNIKRLNGEAAECRRKLSNLGLIESRCNTLGQNLRAHLDRLGRYMNALPAGGTYQMTINGVPYSRESMSETDIWMAITSSPNDESFQVAYTHGGSHRGQLLIPKTDLAEELDDPLSSSEWELRDKTEVGKKLDKIGEDLQALTYATFQDTYARAGFRSDGGLSFAQIVEKHINSDLIRHLVANGFIDQNFALYTSSYYADRVSQRALNFLIHNVDRNVADFDYLLESEDVNAILAERGDSILRERSAYNISILDCLLERNEGKADLLLRSLITGQNQGKEFLTAYLVSGKYQSEMVKHLASEWALIFDFLVKRQDLEDDAKISLIDIALRHASPAVHYMADGEFRSFVEDHEAALSVLYDTSIGDELAYDIAAIFARAGVRLKSLIELSNSIRDAMVADSCFEITIENLKMALTSDDLALDQVRMRDPNVYGYLLRNVPDYLLAMRKQDANPVVVVSIDALSTIITDLLEIRGNLLPEVLDGVDLSARDLELASVPGGAWPALADRDGFACTFANVKEYVDEFGEIDEHLGAFLMRAGEIELVGQIDENDKELLAEEVLAAREHIPDPVTRVGLVVGLGLDSYLSISSAPSEEGQLTGLLIKETVIEDDAEAFGLVLDKAWSTKEFAISQSENFATFMTPVEVPTSDVLQLLGSKVIADEVKDELVTRMDEFIPVDEGAELQAVAEYVVSAKKKLSAQQLVRMVSAGVEQDLLKNMIAISGTGLNFEELTPILDALGVQWKAIVEGTGKRLKIANTAINQTILQLLKGFDKISSFKTKGEDLEVNQKKAKS